MLHRVREEVREHADEECLVDERVHIADDAAERYAACARLGRKLRHALLREILDAHDLLVRLKPTLLHLVDVEERVDHAQQLGDVRFREPQQLAELGTRRVELTETDKLEKRDKAVREVADVVAEHADELLARVLDLAQLFVRAAQLVLETLGVDRAPHACGELDRPDRLRDVVDAADLEALLQVLGVGLGGREDHRDRRSAVVHLEAATGVEAVDARHHDVEQDQVGQLTIGDAQRVLAVRRTKRIGTERLETPHEQIDVRGLVVYHQDAPEALHRCLRSAPADRRGDHGLALVEEAREDRAQLARRVGLRDEVIATGLDGACPVLLHRERRDGDDRDAASPLFLAERLRHGPAVDARQQQIHQDRVGVLRPRRREAGGAVGRADRLVTRGADDPLRHVEVVRVIFDDEHSCRAHDLAPRESWSAGLTRRRTGSVKRKVLPAPIALSTQIRPPWRPTRRFEIARPRPVPP